MKDYERWTANIEVKISNARAKRDRRTAAVKKCVAAVVCLTVLVGSAFSVAYYIGSSTKPQIPPELTGAQSDSTDTQVQTDTDTQVQTEIHTQTSGAETVAPDTSESTASPSVPGEVRGTVTYKTETGEYSWIEDKGSSGIGGTPYKCPEGHNSTGGSSYYHNIPAELIAFVNGLDDDWYKTNEVDRIYKKMYYDNLGTFIKGKCNKLTVKDYIDLHGITREQFDDCIDLVSDYSMNLDVLFGDYDYCDEYYKYNEIFYRRMHRFSNYLEAIFELFDYENAPEGLAMGTNERRRKFRYSVPELAYHYRIGENELREIMESTLATTGYALTFDYDYSVIYNEDGSFREELSALDVRENDFDSVVSYAAELGEAFCRIYDWEDPVEIGDVKKESETGKTWYECVGRCTDSVAYECQNILNERYGQRYIDLSMLRESPFPLKTLIDDYALTREDIEASLPAVGYEVDIPYDILFDGTMDDVLRYYGSVEHRTKHYKTISYELLISFIRRHYTDADGRSLRMYVVGGIPDLVQAGEIERDELIAIIAEIKRCNEASQVYYGGAFYQYDYDLDVIYNEDGSFKDLSGCDAADLAALEVAFRGARSLNPPIIISD